VKTLPDAIIAGMYGDSKVVILVRIIPASGDSWAELCWATNDITITDWEGGGASKSFSGGMLAKDELGTIRQSVDIEQGGNIAKVSGLTLRVLNPEYSFASYNLENREVEIRLAFWTGSSLAWSDTLPLHKFLVEDVSYDYGIYEIKCRDAGLKRHKNIPDLILSDNDYSAIPEYNKGKVAPLLYGDVCDNYPNFYFPNARVYPLIRIDKNKEEFLIARNKCDNMPTDPLLFFDGVQRHAQLYVDSGSFVITYGRPTTIAFPLGVEIKAILGSQLEQQGSQTDPTSLDFANAVDNSDSTYFTLSSSQLLYLKVPMPTAFGAIVGESTNLIFKIRFGTITGTGTMKYYNPEYDNGVGGFSTGQAISSADSNETKPFIFGNDKTAHGKDDDQLDQNDPWTFDEIATYEFGLTMDGSSSAQIENMFIYMNGLLVRSIEGIIKKPVVGQRRRGLDERVQYVVEPFGLDSSENKTMGVQGAEFGSWIDQDGRDNGFNAGQLIQRGAYPIEVILRDELGLVSSQINYGSFDLLGNITDGERKDWYSATAIDSQENSLRIIANYCRQFGTIYLQDYQDKEKVVALKKKTAGKTIDRTTLQMETLQVKLSDIAMVFNEFYLNYDKLWLTGNFRATRYLTASGTNMSSNSRGGTPNTYTGLCSDSQSKYNLTRRLTLDCNWIHSVTTIDLLLKWLAEWHCYRKYIFEFQSAGLDHINWELGDQIKIDHNKITYKCIQVPDLLP